MKKMIFVFYAFIFFSLIGCYENETKKEIPEDDAYELIDEK